MDQGVSVLIMVNPLMSVAERALRKLGSGRGGSPGRVPEKGGLSLASAFSMYSAPRPP